MIWMGNVCFFQESSTIFRKNNNLSHELLIEGSWTESLFLSHSSRSKQIFLVWLHPQCSIKTNETYSKRFIKLKVSTNSALFRISLEESLFHYSASHEQIQVEIEWCQLKHTKFFESITVFCRQFFSLCICSSCFDE